MTTDSMIFNAVVFSFGDDFFTESGFCFPCSWETIFSPEDGDVIEVLLGYSCRR